MRWLLGLSHNLRHLSVPRISPRLLLPPGAAGTGQVLCWSSEGDPTATAQARGAAGTADRPEDSGDPAPLRAPARPLRAPGPRPPPRPRSAREGHEGPAPPALGSPSARAGFPGAASAPLAAPASTNSSSPSPATTGSPPPGPQLRATFAAGAWSPRHGPGRPRGP